MMNDSILILQKWDEAAFREKVSPFICAPESDRKWQTRNVSIVGSFYQMAVNVAWEQEV